MKILECSQADWLQFNYKYLITGSSLPLVTEWTFRYWSPDPGFYVRTSEHFLEPTTDFNMVYKSVKKNYIDLRRFSKNTFFFILLQIPDYANLNYSNWLKNLPNNLTVLKQQYPDYIFDFVEISKSGFWPEFPRLQLRDQENFRYINLIFRNNDIVLYPGLTEDLQTALFPLKVYQDLCMLIQQQIDKVMEHEKQVDIIYLDPVKTSDYYINLLSGLKSPFIKIQLSPDFQNNDLLIQVYTALKKTTATVLLSVPNLQALQELQVRSFDGIFLDIDRNGDELFDLLALCQQQNLRVILRVTSDQKLSFAAGVQLYFPNLPVFIRTDTINFETAYTFFRDKALYLDLPACLAQQFRVSTSLKALNDVVTFLDPSGVYPAQPRKFLQAYQKKQSTCLTCKSSSKCFGYLKDNLSIKILISTQNSLNQISYPSIADRILQIKPVDSQVISFDPENYQQTAGSTGVQAIHQMQKTRLEKKFSGKNFYYIWDFQHSCYFNRPLEATELFKPDSRGLMSLNWQFIGIDNPEMLWKQKCDLLLPKHGFTITTQISFDKYWDTEAQNQLNQLTLGTLQKLILQAGGDSDKLIQVGNDLLYNGKKFCGKEWLFVPNIGYIENTVVTCEYLPEQVWFEKLYHHAKEKPITGITEEVPACTKEYLIWGLHEYCNKFFRGF